MDTEAASDGTGGRPERTGPRPRGPAFLAGHPALLLPVQAGDRRPPSTRRVAFVGSVDGVWRVSPGAADTGFVAPGDVALSPVAVSARVQAEPFARASTRRGRRVAARAQARRRAMGSGRFRIGLGRERLSLLDDREQSPLRPR